MKEVSSVYSIEMDMKPCPQPQIVAKKLWKIVNIVLFMLKKGISKGKLILHLQMLLNCGKRAEKALGHLMLRHQSAMHCCSDDNTLHSHVSPGDYQFSCSSSPIYPSYYTRRKSRSHNHSYHSDNIKAIQMFFDFIENEVPDTSPVALPGFGPSPIVRQLRVTDSPFPIKDLEEDTVQVDRAAEEFIRNFYKELNRQRRI